MSDQAVQRNIDRFPGDFMFQLNVTEFEKWKSQIVTSNPRAAMGLRKRPYAFTEHGVAMLSSVLRSKRAVRVKDDFRSCGLGKHRRDADAHLLHLHSRERPSVADSNPGLASARNG